MSDQDRVLQVALAPDGFYPQAFRWEGRLVRVLAIESVNTFGTERRFRVRSATGRFELGFYTDAGVWRLRRKPGWLGRLWARWQNAPRYPLPVWRRRSRRTVVAAAARAKVAQIRWPSVAGWAGGRHAERLAVVRQ